MSELTTDLTVDGDTAENEKTDCADNAISRLNIESECSENIASKAVIAGEESNLNVQTETELSVEATNDLLGEEVANSNMHAAEITAEIARAVAEDAVVLDDAAQESEVESLTAMTLRSEETPQSKSVNEKKADNSKQNATGDNATYTSSLEAEMRVRKPVESVDCPERNESHQLDNEKRTKERDDYRRKLEETETKLAALQTSYDTITNHGGGEDHLQRSVEQLRGQLAQTALMYEERNRTVTNQESQINALNSQVASLKEVVSITRDLLQIRNMEVKQLQAEVDNMEKKISEERDRHNTMISKMDAAMRLNADLKKEYETQLSLFQSLREKYGEKITLLSAEKRALEAAASAPE